ncbi:actin cytoskeleton-regulatory complex protein END3 [Saitoella complicata NRRL Y-17804]|uniref:Endocytosis protein 3 n=1 Tax=Saitoella complicata (strain BCRC 22490 / CBS 7301 / JCM 7358 / NBRC 10748 / NRRL Y-17804) TaxID=698492 RepID=A0A0E9N898_SAICN|nr:actin cytoskeleton-regulatory complex protein END3 [Saitoella complicata NRRL Y-17804]ODQ54465.1 actin cytoskeleton-regulatory complex protein END3 [Saitoella complicata NRRL Y-17804]GAO45921.1 hypothetical protein G7K_0167-t1 [Saitoella complicata NRRL Y-17804]
MSAQTISEAEQAKYWDIFTSLGPQNGVVSGGQAMGVLRSSQLSDNQLERIWDLADIQGDGNLDFEEFCVAMRLIFDVINGVYPDVPKSLPDFLVPTSKAHLVAANQAVNQGPEQFDQPDDHDLEEPGLSSDFDWYMTPADLRKYENIYNGASDHHGQLSFDALSDLYSSLNNVPDTDLRSAWNLVNPRSDITIGKDQAVAFLHILHQRVQGVRVPRSIPASLRATFQKTQVDYDVNKARTNRAQGNQASARTSKKAEFGQNYLNRMGIGGNKSYESKGTDFSSTKDTDWEEVRLQRQLADIETKIKDTEAEADRRKSRGSSHQSSTALVRRELEAMLDWKRRELTRLDSSTAGAADQSLEGARNDVDMLKQQLDALENHLSKRENELQQVLAEIDREKSST